MSEPQEKMSRLSAGVTSEIMVALVVILFFVFVVLFILYLRSKHCHGALPITTRTSQVHFIPASPGHPQPHRGLDPAILQSLSLFVFRACDSALECPVCLCELSEGETARRLPTCKHGFHVKCIDMWFHSNDTCPLCRTPISEGTAPVFNSKEVGSNRADGESSSSARNSFGKGDGAIVIEIPRRMSDGVESPSASSPLPLSRHAAAAAPIGRA